MKHSERICVCGNKYKYCPSCPDKNKVEPWKLRWCSENCREIDKILCNYEAKIINRNEAKDQLSYYNCSNIENWPEGYKKTYRKIMGNKTNNIKYSSPMEDKVTYFVDVK